MFWCTLFGCVCVNAIHHSFSNTRCWFSEVRVEVQQSSVIKNILHCLFWSFLDISPTLLLSDQCCGFLDSVRVQSCIKDPIGSNSLGLGIECNRRPLEFLYGITKPYRWTEHLCKYNYTAESKPCYYEPDNAECAQKIACLHLMLDPI